MLADNAPTDQTDSLKKVYDALAKVKGLSHEDQAKLTWLQNNMGQNGIPERIIIGSTKAADDQPEFQQALAVLDRLVCDMATQAESAVDKDTSLSHLMAKAFSEDFNSSFLKAEDRRAITAGVPMGHVQCLR